MSSFQDKIKSTKQELDSTVSEQQEKQKAELEERKKLEERCKAECTELIDAGIAPAIVEFSEAAGDYMSDPRKDISDPSSGRASYEFYLEAPAKVPSGKLSWNVDIGVLVTADEIGVQCQVMGRTGRNSHTAFSRNEKISKRAKDKVKSIRSWTESCLEDLFQGFQEAIGQEPTEV